MMTLERLAALTEMALDGCSEGALFEIGCVEMVDILVLAIAGARLSKPHPETDYLERPEGKSYRSDLDAQAPGERRGSCEVETSRVPDTDHGGLDAHLNSPGQAGEDLAGTGASASVLQAPGPLPTIPACCVVGDDATLAEQLYCAYNFAGANPGLNYKGKPCPVWSVLPADIRHKWEAVADFAVDEVAESLGLFDLSTTVDAADLAELTIRVDEE